MRALPAQGQQGERINVTHFIPIKRDSPFKNYPWNLWDLCQSPQGAMSTSK
jgi:hypothetical protein